MLTDNSKEKAAKFSVPLPKVRGISEEEVFKVIKSGKKTHKKSWKRMVPLRPIAIMKRKLLTTKP